MVGRCIPYWNSPFLRDMLVFGAALFLISYFSCSHFEIGEIWEKNLPETNMAPVPAKNGGPQKEVGSSSNHQSSGAVAVSFREGE